MEKIFIQIASYRDPELPKTVASALSSAEHPERLVFGICRQFNPDDGCDSLDAYAGDARFRIDDVDCKDSRGCCWARARVQALWQDEEYTLQLDAHHRFADGWDSDLIDMLDRCDSPKPIVTSYAPQYNILTEVRNPGSCRMRPIFQGIPVITRFRPESLGATKLMRHPFWSGHLMFTRGSFCREVPYDPELYFIGEEISMAARSWTSGYDMFLPDKTTVWHQYVAGGKRTRHWTDHTRANGSGEPYLLLDKISKRRVTRLLSGEDLGVFGLGTVRTLEDYENAAGICFRKSYISPEAAAHAAMPIFSDDAWVPDKVRVFKVKLDWSSCLDELEAYGPGSLAVFMGGERRDLPCRKGIPVSLDIAITATHVPENYTVWPYKLKPLDWGPKKILKVLNYAKIN